MYSSLFGSFTYMLLKLVLAIKPRTERIILCSLASNYSVGSILSTFILVAPINCGRPSCLPALLLLVRGGGEGSSCGRATYVAVIWFGQLKMIRFEMFTLVFFNKYFSFGFSRTLLLIDSLIQIGEWVFHFYLYCNVYVYTCLLRSKLQMHRFPQKEAAVFLHTRSAITVL